jgi:hypothetical protein
MSLIYDEVEQFENRIGLPLRFRIRVFRKKGKVPVVIVSEVDKGSKPWMMTCKVANWAWSALCGYDPKGIHYIEHHKDYEGIDRWQHVVFEKFSESCPSRARLYRPASLPITMSELVGCVLQEPIPSE